MANRILLSTPSRLTYEYSGHLRKGLSAQCRPNCPPRQNAYLARGVCVDINFQLTNSSRQPIKCPKPIVDTKMWGFCTFSFQNLEAAKFFQASRTSIQLPNFTERAHICSHLLPIGNFWCLLLEEQDEQEPFRKQATPALQSAVYSLA